MKNLIKIFISYFIIAIITISGITVMAETKATATLKIGTATANIGDFVYVPMSIEDNPGVSGITATITYDASALEYLEYAKGPAFTDSVMLKDHPNKNMLKFVIVEYNSDTFNNDDIITFKFKVRDSAKAKLYKIDMNYTKGDLASRGVKNLNVKILSGGVKVNYSPEAQNCPHENYGEWVQVVKPTCDEKGVNERSCELCGKKDFGEIEPAGHNFKTEWTIDTPATKSQDGVMTRHCKHCSATTDRLTFKFKDTEKENITNQVGAAVSKNSYTQNLLSEQHPQAESSSKSSVTSDDDTESVQLPTVSKEIVLNEQGEEIDDETQNNKQSFIQKYKTLLIVGVLLLILVLIVAIVFVILKK